MIGQGPGIGLMPKIAVTNAIIIGALLAVAVVALLTAQPGLADTIVGAVIGAVLGAGATTVIVSQHMGKGDTTDDTGTTTKAP